MRYARYALPKALFDKDVTKFLVIQAEGRYIYLEASPIQFTIDTLNWPKGFWIDFVASDGSTHRYTDGGGDEDDIDTVFGVYTDEGTAAQAAAHLNVSASSMAARSLHNEPESIFCKSVAPITYPVLLHENTIQYKRGGNLQSGIVIGAFVYIDLLATINTFAIHYTVAPNAVVGIYMDDLITVNATDIVAF